MRAVSCLILAALVAASGALPARAAGSDAPMVAAARGFAQGVGSPGFASACTADATVIDSVPPYFFKAPRACATWWSSVLRAFGAMRVTNLRIASLRTLYSETSGRTGYCVFSARLDMRLKGAPHSETGTWTFSMRKVAGAWKVAATSWGQTSPP